MNKTGSNSGHFVKYWVKLTLLKYTNKMVISDQKRKINGMAPKIPKVYQVWQLSCYSTQLEKLNLGAFLKMATNWTSFVHSALYIKKSIFQFKYQKEYEICTLSGPSDMVWVEQEKIQLWKLDTENSTQRMQ